MSLDQEASSTLKIPLVADAISALATMSTVKAVRATDITETQNVVVGEMGVNLSSEPELEFGLEAEPEDKPKSDPDPDPDPDSDADADADSDSSSSSSSSSSSESNEADPENGVLPGDLIVATDTFTFDIADAPTDLLGLSIASNW